MLPRFRRFLDVRPGEGLPVLLTFLYIAAVVAAFLLAKPIRNGLFLHHYGAYAIVYVYVTVPLALSLFVPAYTRIAARFGSRKVSAATLVFFSANVVVFWLLFRFAPFRLLPGIFYVWVNCFAVIAPVQAWSFANSQFDTRQARRLFGLFGASASLGAIGGGVLARVLVEPVGGTVNMLLVLAALILVAAGIVAAANRLVRRQGPMRRARPESRRLGETLEEILRSPYLRLIAALVFLAAIVTLWIDLQMKVVANLRYGTDSDALTRFYGTFNVLLGVFSFVVQLAFTRRLLRRFGVAVTILMLPLALGLGSTLIVLVPGFLTVALTGGLDQGFRFSVDKATYELLYLPIAPAQRLRLKGVIDIVVSRTADAVGAILIGVATRGFLFIRGIGIGVRGTAAVNLGLIAAWLVVAWRIRVEYVRTIRDSIHRHRLDAERTSTTVMERSAAVALSAKLAAADPSEVRYALELLESQQTRAWHPVIRDLLAHPEPDIRRRALAILSTAGDRSIADSAAVMLHDTDLGVRTEALLYLSRNTGVDPLKRIQELGRFEEFSIRAAMAAFLAADGPAQNLDAARAILEKMIAEAGPDGARERTEATRVVALAPARFPDLLVTLLADEHPDVAREAIRCAGASTLPECVAPLIDLLSRPALADDAAVALARYGQEVVPALNARLLGEAAPIAVKREIPGVLVRIGGAAAVQALLQSLLHSDATLRHRVIASLNKLEVTHPRVRLDPGLIELLLAAEIAGHYRSYQILGPLRAQLKDGDPVLEAMRRSMDEELERIFRLMALLFPEDGLHDAYVGLRSSNPIVRADALEFLDNVLKPELRQVLVPVLDAHVTIDERIALANRIVGAPLESVDQAVATMLASEDKWLKSCAVYAVGVLHLQALEPEVRKVDASADPELRERVDVALQRLAGEAEPQELPEPAPPDMGMGVGAG